MSVNASENDNTYLNPLLLEIDAQSQLLPEHDVGVVRLVEGALELLELLLGEDGAVAALALGRRAREPGQRGRRVAAVQPCVRGAVAHAAVRAAHACKRDGYLEPTYNVLYLSINTVVKF